MTDLPKLDQAYALVIRHFVDTGRAPHYTEVARSLSVGMEEGRQIVHDLVEELPAWTEPGTDLFSSFAPFNSQPTHYRISVEGQQKWYGQ